MVSSVSPVSSSTASTSAQSGGAANGDAVEAEVTSLPPSLESTDRAVTLRGEVQSVNDDGTTTISTPRGPVDVKLPDPQPTPGQRVEVTVQAGSPPTDASVRTIQTQSPPAQGQGSDAPQGQAPAPSTGTSGPPPASSSTASPPATPNDDPPAVQVSWQGAPQAPAQGQGQQGTPPPANPTTLPAVPLLQEEGQQAQSPVATTAQTQGPVQTPGQQAAQQAANASPPSSLAQPQISPQGLLNFLKTQLQAVLQAPPQAGAAPPSLQPGQLVRLIPTPGQTPVALPQPGALAGHQPALQPDGGMKLPAISSAGAPGGLQITPAPLSSDKAPLFQIAQQNTPILRALQTILGAPAASSPAAPAAIAANAPPINITLTPETDLIALARDVNGLAIQPRPGITVIGPLAVLPQNHAPIIDARLAATMPVIQPLAAQNPGIATLLHGSPATSVLFGQVIGENAQGLPLIQIPIFGDDPQPKMIAMTLQFPARALAPGTWVRMDVVQSTVPASAAAAVQTAAATETWGDIENLAATLRAQPQTAAIAALVQNVLPKPGAAAFTAPVLMYLAAARSGDAAAWLGERISDAIRNTRRGDLLAKISGTLSTADTRMRDDAPQAQGQWRSLMLPLMAQGQQVHQVMMHYRFFEREGENGQNGKKQTGARFVLDLSLSRIGPMQVDGLSFGRQLDVTLRSEQSFSAAMRESLRTRYTDALNGIGFSGQLNFRADGDHKGWVDFTTQAVSRTAAQA